MKLNKFAYLCSKPLGNRTLKLMKKIPGNLLKNLEKSWKYHGILSVRKSGNPESTEGLNTTNIIGIHSDFNNPALKLKLNHVERVHHKESPWV